MGSKGVETSLRDTPAIPKTNHNPKGKLVMPTTLVSRSGGLIRTPINHNMSKKNDIRERATEREQAAYLMVYPRSGVVLVRNTSNKTLQQLSVDVHPGKIRRTKRAAGVSRS